nr:Chain s, model substrate polypeptide [Homo sapiens]
NNENVSARLGGASIAV